MSHETHNFTDNWKSPMKTSISTNKSTTIHSFLHSQRIIPNQLSLQQLLFTCCNTCYKRCTINGYAPLWPLRSATLRSFCFVLCIMLVLLTAEHNYLSDLGRSTSSSFKRLTHKMTSCICLYLPLCLVPHTHNWWPSALITKLELLVRVPKGGSQKTISCYTVYKSLY